MAQSEVRPNAPQTAPDPAPRGSALVEDPWESFQTDASLSASVAPGPPGNTPPGEDLDLRVGWDRFEKLVLAVARGALGLRGIRFRRYGVQGQAQHGIDLAGREPDGRYTVIQCKDYQEFTAADLDAAVEKFTTGRRPFAAYRLIVATSASTQTTQVAEKLASLQDAHFDLELDLWGSEQINDHLRYQGDVVARFWTRETAETFCTGAPPAGVPVPPPDRQEQAETVLVGPLRTENLAPILRKADAQRSIAPSESAQLYGGLAERLEKAGYRGHAVTMRGKQLDALVEARLIDEAVDLAALLAAMALHFGDQDESRLRAHLIVQLTGNAAGEIDLTERTHRHANLIIAADNGVRHPLGNFDGLQTALESHSAEEPDYQPLLVLLLTEHLLAADPDRLNALDHLITSAIKRAGSQPFMQVTEDAAVRLRLVRAEYNAAERTELQRLARLHRVSGRHAALIRAREGRRCALEGRAEEALEGWSDAVHDAIHAGLTEDAADWLYAIRALNAQYCPLTSDIDDEHRLAQALRATGSGRLLNRARYPREHALSAVVSERPVEAALSARRWLTDSVVTGDWAGEGEALTFLADLYRDNSEPALSAEYYQRAGRAKKLKELAFAVGDIALPVEDLSNSPWWVLYARATLLEAQADLLDDDAAGFFLGELTDLAERGRAGELTDSAFGNLTIQATNTACALAARGTSAQALAILDLLATDVPREANHYHRSDSGHANACVAIATMHPELAMTALTRLFDLADGGVHEALQLVVGDEVVRLLTRYRDQATTPGQLAAHAVSEDEWAELSSRIAHLDDTDRYLADVARFIVDPSHPSVLKRANQARDRILGRTSPTPGLSALGSRLVSDSYLIRRLDHETRRSCLEKLLAVAGDRREVAMNRQDALTGAQNLIIDLPEDIRQTTFHTASSFVRGERDGSHLDDELTGTPHPLSSFKISMGPASLRGSALLLAAASASTLHEGAWVRDQAIALLRSEDTADVHAAAHALIQLPMEAAGEIDAGLLAAHPHTGVRQASAVLCLRHPTRYRSTAMQLAMDKDFRVRRTLAQAAAQADESEPTAAILDLLACDRRHSVRVAARSGA